VLLAIQNSGLFVTNGQRPKGGYAASPSQIQLD